MKKYCEECCNLFETEEASSDHFCKICAELIDHELKWMAQEFKEELMNKKETPDMSHSGKMAHSDEDDKLDESICEEIWLVKIHTFSPKGRKMSSKDLKEWVSKANDAGSSDYFLEITNVRKLEPRASRFVWDGGELQELELS